MNAEKEVTILIVDDEPDNLQALADLLKASEKPYNIIRALDGQVALKMAIKKQPDLVITDWEMPVMNGIEFIRQLRHTAEIKDTPVIMCTGVMTTSKNLQTALEAGASDYIRKPVDPIELVARTNSMLELAAKSKQIIRQNEIIALEMAKSDQLLHNILPEKVVRELKETGKTTPESYPSVTVYMSDLVGFTPTSARLKPEVLISELNDLFTGFDDIMTQNDCERIETVGDAYLAVCGMPEPNENHAVNIIKAAMEILQFVADRNHDAAASGKQTWQLRIGINTGAVVGGVVGIRKYSYNVFGDTINTASRMETNSEPMRINVSESTYQCAKDRFSFIAREPIEVKGKGLFKMYFLDAINSF